MSRSELLGSVVAEVHLRQIAAVIGIGRTADQSDVVVRELDVYDTLITVEEDHPCHVVSAERPGIVQRSINVEKIVEALVLGIRQRGVRRRAVRLELVTFGRFRS